jgi:hypothetical protein
MSAYLRSFVDKGPRYYVRNFKEDPKISVSRIDDRIGPCALLQANFASVQHVQKQER